MPPVEPSQAARHDGSRQPDRRPPCARPGRRWHSEELFGTEQEIEIEHGHSVYRLRLTSLGKLILTK